MLKTLLSTTAIALSLSLAPMVALADDHGAPAMEMDMMEATETTISPEKMALIEELRTLTKSDDHATQVLDIMMSQIQDQAIAMGESMFGEDTPPEVTQAFNETFDRIVTRMYSLMQERIDFVTVQKKIETQLYDEYYTTSELEDLIAFYQTPTGQKTAEILPQMTQRSMELMGAEITPAMVEIQQQVLMEEFSAFGFGEFDDTMEPSPAEEMPMMDDHSMDDHSMKTPLEEEMPMMDDHSMEDHSMDDHSVE